MRLGTALGVPADVDPLEALMQCIHSAAGEMSYCSDRIATLSTREELALPVPSLHAQAWIYARHEAMDRLARYCKMAIDAGLADRQVANAEQLGGIIGKLLHDVLAELSLSAEQQAVAPNVVRRHLTLMAQSTDSRA